MDIVYIPYCSVNCLQCVYSFKFTEHTRPENEIIEILTPEIVEKLKTMIETKLGYVEIEVIKSALKL